jgi:hypothetical protein
MRAEAEARTWHHEQLWTRPIMKKLRLSKCEAFGCIMPAQHSERYNSKFCAGGQAGIHFAGAHAHKFYIPGPRAST